MIIKKVWIIGILMNILVVKKKISFVLLVFFISGCSLSTIVDKEKLTVAKQEVFVAPFERVWRATQIALAHYPIRVNNMDQGILETDKIHSYDGWHAPHKRPRRSGGLKRKLVIKMVKGRYRGKQVTKVTVRKKISLKRSFFSEKQELESDGLEEMALIYRIKRELQIERAVEKSNK